MTGPAVDAGRRPAVGAPTRPPHRAPFRAPWHAPAALLALLVLVAAAAPALVGPPPEDFPLDQVELAYLPPSFAHLLGTDGYGREVVHLLVYGLRISLVVATLSMSLAVSIGTTYGVLAAWLGGPVERALLRLLDVLLAIPRVLVLLAVVAFWGGTTPAGVALVLGLTGWFDVARVVRADVATLRGRDWMAAARAGGVPAVRIAWRHLLPHLTPTLGVTGALGVASAVALEAGLSYLGLGVQAPRVSLGTMLADGVAAASSGWWLTVFPALGIGSLVLAFTALGDALRAPRRPGQVAA